jgi:NAD(P)-dependent dehydrogenase (short-subunit alcohol dehydrogenase family)
MQIRGHVFLVTGAASGLGAAVTRMIAHEGGSVVAVDLNRDAGETLRRELGASSAFIASDVTKESDAKAAIETALNTFGHVHGLVNCAGIAPPERVLGKEGPHRLDSFVRVLNVNLIGTFNMIRLAAEAMARENPKDDGERGVIVNTASVAAYEGQIGQAAYAASKGGVVALTLPVARELARYGIRVVTIAPGVFETPMMAGFSPEVQEALGKSVPFPQRLGKPEEYAALVKQICENTMLNGETIRLDGALRMAPK